jgi:hypothetical protein
MFHGVGGVWFWELQTKECRTAGARRSQGKAAAGQIQNRRSIGILCSLVEKRLFFGSNDRLRQAGKQASRQAGKQAKSGVRKITITSLPWRNEE